MSDDVRNYEEYRAQALASLGEDYTVEDLRNEKRFRSKVLDGLGVSYETDDLVNFEKYRIKVLQGIAGGGGGGSSDFTLATITLADPDDLGFKMTSAFITEGTESIITEFRTNDAGSVNIILYKGSATVRFAEGGIVNTNVSGNATKSGKFITVTGDCTFTIYTPEPPEP